MISVWIGIRFGGGVLMMLRSRAPRSENWRVLGIGVAVNVRVSTDAFRWRSLSFAATPNFCSSSMTSRPRSLNSKPAPSTLWVPIRMSIFPSFSLFLMSVISFAVRRRLT